MASPLGPAAVPQPDGEGDRQGGGGAGQREEGGVRDPEEDGEGQAVAPADHHRGAAESCGQHSGAHPQHGGTRGSHHILFHSE